MVVSWIPKRRLEQRSLVFRGRRSAISTRMLSVEITIVDRGSAFVESQDEPSLTDEDLDPRAMKATELNHNENQCYETRSIAATAALN
jgi:hypothetical protein